MSRITESVFSMERQGEKLKKRAMEISERFPGSSAECLAGIAVSRFCDHFGMYYSPPEDIFPDGFRYKPTVQQILILLEKAIGREEQGIDREEQKRQIWKDFGDILTTKGRERWMFDLF